jgi:beta-phosphoglucomutase
MQQPVTIPSLGTIAPHDGMRSLAAASDGRHRVGEHGVVSITATGDGRVEFIAWEQHTLALVNSALGYPAYYPVHAVHLETPVRAVLMDLDGTSVKSEPFWIWIIEQTLASLMRNPRFSLEDADLPHVSGHSVSEHLQYGIDKYCPGETVEAARALYFAHTRREMAAIVEGSGRADAFIPADGLKEALLTLKARGVRIGLVTSGLYEKAYPEILAAFRTLGMGDPAAFYDAIITAGAPLGQGAPGTLGELSPKPHPWLYAETARVGLGIPFSARGSVVGIEDSGAGIAAVRLAGFSAIGMRDGNIIASGTQALATAMVGSLAEAIALLL